MTSRLTSKQNLSLENLVAKPLNRTYTKLKKNKLAKQWNLRADALFAERIKMTQFFGLILARINNNKSLTPNSYNDKGDTF